MNAVRKPDEETIEAIRERIEETFTPEDYLSPEELSSFLMNAMEIIDGLLGDKGKVPEYREMFKTRYNEWVLKPMNSEKEKMLDLLVKQEIDDYLLP